MDVLLDDDRAALEAVRARLRIQLAAQPDTETWDETSQDRLWLVGVLTRILRSNGKPSSNGKYSPPGEYTGDTCSFCGSLNMRRCGNCSRCDNCGESGGCS